MAAYAILIALAAVPSLPANSARGDAPADEPLSKDFAVKVDRRSLAVHLARVAPADEQRRWKAMDDAQHPSEYFDLASFATFDMDKPVTIQVTAPQPIRSVVILPTSAAIKPTLDGNQIRFTLDKPRPLTLELNGNWSNSLHLLANPLEKNPPKSGDANVIYFGAGIHELRDSITVTSGMTVYLADGAIVRGVGANGPMFFLKGDHITLRGRGIIDGTLCPRHTRHMIRVTGSDITLEGVILRDCSTWNVPIRQSDRVHVDNIKIFGCRANSDGIDICNSRDVTVENCFLRTLDDLVVVKSDKGQGPVHHVVVRNCTLWNQVAHALSIGAELRDPVDDVLFTDCDVIHDKGREWTLRVYHCDSAVVSNVRFQNIRVEESKRLISLWIGKAVWSREAERGHIKGVTFENIQATANPGKVELKGFDAEHAVEDVTFKNVVVNGKPLGKDEVKCNEFVRLTKFE
jgi:hypothetical protein